MAKFVLEVLKQGYEGSTICQFACLKAVIFDESDEVVVAPSMYQDLPVTHLGYKQGFEPAHEHWHDWHHPTAYGSEWREAQHTLEYATDIVVPQHVKLFVLPKHLKQVRTRCIVLRGNTTLQIDPGNPNIQIVNNQIEYK